MFRREKPQWGYETFRCWRIRLEEITLVSIVRTRAVRARRESICREASAIGLADTRGCPRSFEGGGGPRLSEGRPEDTPFSRAAPGREGERESCHWTEVQVAGGASETGRKLQSGTRRVGEARVRGCGYGSATVSAETRSRVLGVCSGVARARSARANSVENPTDCDTTVTAQRGARRVEPRSASAGRGSPWLGPMEISVSARGRKQPTTCGGCWRARIRQRVARRAKCRPTPTFARRQE